MNFGIQLNENAVTEPSHTNERTEMKELTEGQKDNQDNDVQSSPDFSYLVTDVGDNPYIRRHPQIESQPSTPKINAYNRWI